MKVTVSARIGTLRAIAPEGEDKMKPKIAGTLTSNTIPLELVSAKALPRISEAPETSVTFLRRRAPNAANVTSQSVGFFTIFGKSVKLVRVIIRMLITPARVATAIFRFKIAVRRTVTIIGEKEYKSSLMLAFVPLFVSLFFSLVFFVFLNPKKYPIDIITITVRDCMVMREISVVSVRTAVRIRKGLMG